MVIGLFLYTIVQTVNLCVIINLEKRKEIYEEIYQDGKANVFKGNQYIDVPDAPIAFTTDAAEKLKISKYHCWKYIKITIFNPRK